MITLSGAVLRDKSVNTMQHLFFKCPLCSIIRPLKPEVMLRPGMCKHEKKEFINYIKSEYAVCLACVDSITCIYCGNLARTGPEYAAVLEKKLRNMLPPERGSLLEAIDVPSLYRQHIDSLKTMSRDKVVAEYTK